MIRNLLWVHHFYLFGLNYRIEKSRKLAETLHEPLIKVDKSKKHLNVYYLLQFEPGFDILNSFYSNIDYLTSDHIAQKTIIIFINMVSFHFGKKIVFSKAL